jgi:membrane protein YqaA with SNARE-associated domain
MSLAARPAAEAWLALISFVESSIFFIPADILFIPMTLSRPERAWRYAFVATATSVLGGIAGWFLGYFAFEAMRDSADASTILLLLITSGLAHLPPIKVVTILSGAMHVNIWLFIASALAARGARFYLLAWLLRRYGEPIRHFVEKRLGVIAGVAAAVVILLYILYKYLH